MNTEKLKILISHLKGHNEDHAKEIIELAQKAKKLGHDEVHDLLLKSAKKSFVFLIFRWKKQKNCWQRRDNRCVWPKSTMKKEQSLYWIV